MTANRPTIVAITIVAAAAWSSFADAGAVDALVTIANGQYPQHWYTPVVSGAAYPATVTLLPDRATAVGIELLPRRGGDGAFSMHGDAACAVVTPDCRCWRWAFDGVVPPSVAVYVNPLDALHVAIDVAPDFDGTELTVSARLVPDATRVVAPAGVWQQFAMALPGADAGDVAAYVDRYCTEQLAAPTAVDLLVDARYDVQPRIWHRLAFVAAAPDTEEDEPDPTTHPAALWAGIIYALVLGGIGVWMYRELREIS
jgi:hypothetical protein